MGKKKKFNRQIGKEFAEEVEDKAQLAPSRALKVLKGLRTRAVIEDARTTRQKRGKTPAVISMLEYKAIIDAIRLLKVRLQLMYNGTSKAS